MCCHLWELCTFKLESNDKNTWFFQHFVNILSKNFQNFLNIPFSGHKFFEVFFLPKAIKHLRFFQHFVSILSKIRREQLCEQLMAKPPTTFGEAKSWLPSGFFYKKPRGACLPRNKGAPKNQKVLTLNFWSNSPFLHLFWTIIFFLQIL